jgi:hypothetical protein
MPPFDAGIPDIKAMFSGRPYVYSAINIALTSPRHLRLAHLSGTQIGDLPGFTVEDFVETVEVLTEHGVPPHPDYLSVPERADVRHEGSRDNAQALILAEISYYDPLKPSRARSTIIRVLRSVGRMKSFDPRELSIGGMREFSENDLILALRGDGLGESEISTMMGRFKAVLLDWEVQLSS